MGFVLFVFPFKYWHTVYSAKKQTISYKIAEIILQTGGPSPNIKEKVGGLGTRLTTCPFHRAGSVHAIPLISEVDG